MKVVHLNIFTSIILGTAGIAVAVATGTTLESFSIFVLGLGGVFGLAAGIADEIDPLRWLFNRGQWVISVIAIFFLFWIVFSPEETAGPIVIGFALAFSSGVLLGTIGIIARNTV
ncbi:hypothetical protein [Natronorubrum sp. DTA7]|uniref:hypothetical protein n=1 Tax=Natronorubrum sp. DTA7 TaxID=3447016 RepID=UPI003F84496C